MSEVPLYRKFLRMPENGMCGEQVGVARAVSNLGFPERQRMCIAKDTACALPRIVFTFARNVRVRSSMGTSLIRTRHPPRTTICP